MRAPVTQRRIPQRDPSEQLGFRRPKAVPAEAATGGSLDRCCGAAERQLYTSSGGHVGAVVEPGPALR